MVIQLSDVIGGGTAFPRFGSVATPTPGSLLFWYNLHPDGSQHKLSLHAGCPTLFGLKWGEIKRSSVHVHIDYLFAVANKWIHEPHQVTKVKRIFALAYDDCSFAVFAQTMRPDLRCGLELEALLKVTSLVGGGGGVKASGYRAEEQDAARCTTCHMPFVLWQSATNKTKMFHQTYHETQRVYIGQQGQDQTVMACACDINHFVTWQKELHHWPRRNSFRMNCTSFFCTWQGVGSIAWASGLPLA